MCGIVGILQPHPLGGDARGVLAAMTETLRHRGPDDGDVWLDERAGVGLGHRRLSILDLSPAGHQPMRSADGRYVIAFNGEIYNFQALRRDLLSCGRQFRGHSDTEVFLEAVSQWGLEKAIERFNGMFAFVLWDRQAGTLSLGRDRVGEKPLYYGRSGGTFLCASELKALRAYPGFKGEIDRDILTLFLRYGYVPAPHCIFRGIRKLPPGTLLTVRAGEASSEPVPYWSLRDVVERGTADLFQGSDDDAAAYLEGLLREAVGLRMVADVPLGAFLSGGIDSSTVVALMQAQSKRPVKTFSVGFHEADYDEAGFARGVARHLGTDHTELYVTPAEARAVIPRLPALYDEPFADPSQIPTFLISQLARRQVTVSLSGDGGDEVFGGYNRYFLGQRIWSSVGWMPKSVRMGAGKMLRALSPTTWDTLFRRVGPVLPNTVAVQNPGDKLQKLAGVLTADHPRALYWGLVSLWKNPTDVVAGAVEPVTIFSEAHQPAGLHDFRQQMMFMDTMAYLPDDILVKVDRASMGVSLEARVPILDHRVVEFAWRLPVSMKIRHGQGKWILRKVLDRYVPQGLIDRPKMGFGVPIDSWLRGPLRDWSETLLDEGRLRADGFFDPRPIREKWSEHLAGRRNWQYLLWCVLMFQAWLDEQKRCSSGTAG
jgi:asparagine synthase (glutamine-hydrolysing)